MATRQTVGGCCDQPQSQSENQAVYKSYHQSVFHVSMLPPLFLWILAIIIWREYVHSVKKIR